MVRDQIVLLATMAVAEAHREQEAERTMQEKLQSLPSVPCT